MEYDYPTFRERMQAGRDAATQVLAQAAYLGAAVKRKRPRLVVPWTVAEVAAWMGNVSQSRVKLLCSQDRFVGAYRSQTGQGKPWVIPAHWNARTRRYAPILEPRAKGPALRHYPVPVVPF